MRNLFLFIYTFFCILTQAQNTLTGIVLSDKNRGPVAFASVYISGTTKGTYTDSKGCFTLKDVSTPCKLVVSHVAYDLKIMTLDNINSNLLTIDLTEKTNNLSGVSVSGNSRRKGNIKEFKKFFLGTDQWGKKAILKNDSGLVFNRVQDTIIRKARRADFLMQEYKKTLGANSNWSSDSSSIFNYIDVFTAKTKSPLLIELPLLGYTVYLDLVSFNLKSINNKKALDYLMYCRFEQIKTASTHQKNVIEKNRQQVYYNSAKHFCKSIFDNKLKENGFLIAFDNFIFTYPKLENRTFVDINPYLHYVNTKEVQVIGLKNKQLDIYYFCKYKGRPTNLAIKSKKVGSSNIPFEDCFIEDDSYVIFKSDTCIIRPDGTIPDNNIQFGGKMASKAGGALLPNDYLPENDN